MENKMNKESDTEQGITHEQDVVEDQNDFLFEYDEISISEIRSRDEVKVLPSSTRKQLTGLAGGLDKDAFTKLNNEDKGTTRLNLETEDYVNPDDVGARDLTSNLTNDPKFEDISLKGKSLVINKRVKTASAALKKLGQRTGMGPNIHIPLHHSGFWVTYAPLNDEEIINLELEIVNELARVGKETSTLVFSNYNVIFAEVVLKFFKDKLLESTLKLEDGDDIFDYININDIYTIALFMAKSMYPMGFQVVIPCSNNSKLDNGVPACSYKASMKVDLGELLWVDESKLTLDHKQQMSKKTPNSITIDDVMKYQETLPTNGDVTKTFKSASSDDDVKLILGPVSVSRYLESGQDFINELKDSAIELIKTNKQIDTPDAAERLLLNGIYLNVYSHYIKGLPIDDAVITDTNDVREALKILTTDHTMSKDIMTSIREYIDNSLIAIVGIPNFICVSCKTEQTRKELIPLAVYEYLFILLHSKYEKVMARL